MDLFDGGIRNLTQHVTHVLGQAIVQGKYDANGVLPTEADISVEFNTSRSVTREAVKMLTAKGLIASRPRQGIKIQPKNSWNLFDSDVLGWLSSVQPSVALLQEFAQMRQAIEPEAVALAARLGSIDKIFAIGQAVATIEKLLKQKASRQQLINAEVAFHTAILQASGNRFFGQFGDFIQTALQATLTFRLEGGDENLGDHSLFQRIYDAISRGRQQEGRAAMRELLDSSLQTINA